MTNSLPSQNFISGSAGARPVLANRREALYDAETTCLIEHDALAQLPNHTLMSRAGLSVARLALALNPHARTIWVACGPGNNGGDGLVAAAHLHQWAQAQGGSPRVVVTHWTRNPSDDSRVPADARQALAAAKQSGVVFAEHPPEQFDLAIDALMGIGAMRPVQGRLGSWLSLLRTTSELVLCVDVPSGLNADTGALEPTAGTPPHARPGPRYTLSLLTLKPGLFTAHGRDAAGQVWLDDLGVEPPTEPPVTAWLAGQQEPIDEKTARAHASHKGSFGDVMVIGGQGISVNGAGMTGAALLAARAALHAGAGRVFVGLLQEPGVGELTWDPVSPELMFRQPDLLLERATLREGCVVCGCGGGDAVRTVLHRVLSGATRLVLDADALNAIANDPSLQSLLRDRQGRGWSTVLTPHPLEAARLLGCHTATVMADRLRAAQALADSFGVICVLKGSGTVIAAPRETPWINPTGSAALATAGTGDVLAGMVGSSLARPSKAVGSAILGRVAEAVFQHGWLADHWPAGSGLCASDLAARVRPLS